MPTLSFPKPELTPIVGAPDPAAIKLLTAEVYQNARSHPSDLGGGAHGHLGVIMPAAPYFLLAGAAFLSPGPPGLQAPPAANATNAQIAAADRLHDRNKVIYTDYVAVRDGLKQQILTAVEERYYSILKDPVFLYADVNPRDLLTHLRANYGVITAEDLEKNRDALRADWNPDDGIETLWDRVRTCQAFADGTTNEITDETAMALTLETLSNSGVLAEHIRNWKMKPAATRASYDEFRSHFNDANKIRVEELTSRQAGFGAANNLQEQLAETNRKLDAALAAAPSPASTEARVVPPGGHKPVTNGKEMFYCHSHGISFLSQHTSCTCKNPKEGHEKTATIFNMMGGCRLINIKPVRART